jgi:hypothetical protein
MINISNCFDDQDIFLNREELIKERTNTKSISSIDSPPLDNNIKIDYSSFLENNKKYKINDLIIEKTLIPKINNTIIDENIKRRPSGRWTYSNGYLEMINGTATYIVPTPYYYDNNQINIYYELNSNGNKKMAYYDEDIFYILADTEN